MARISNQTNIRILVVDNDSAHRERTGSLLSEERDYHVEEAANGKEALDFLLNQKFDLILVDLQMPRMDGEALIREIRQDFQDIAIIVLTGQGAWEDAHHLLNQDYVNDFLFKPFHWDELLFRIKKSLEKRKREGEQYRQILEASPDALIVHRDEKILFFNSSALTMFGATQSKQLLGKPIIDLIHPDHRETVRQRNRLVTQHKEEPPFLEYPLIRLDGTLFYGEASARPFAYNGKLSVLSSFRDISVRKATEDLIKTSENRYRQLVETSPDAVFIQTEGEVVFVNSAGIRLLKATSQEQIVGQSIYDFVAPEFKELAKTRINHVLATMQAVPFRESILVDFDGSPIDVEVTAVPFHFQGKLSVQVLARDISQRKRQARELTQWKDVFEQASWGIALFRENSVQLETFNTAFAELHGYTKEELCGKTIYDLHSPGNQEKITDIIKSATAQNQFDHEINRTRKDGTIFPAQIDTATIRDDQGKILYRIVNVMDIGDRKKAELALEVAYANLELRVKERTQELQNTNEALRLAQEELKAFVNALPGIVFILDEEGRHVEIFSRKNQLMLGTVEEMRGKLLHDLMPKDIADVLLNTIRQTLESNEIQKIEYSMEGHEGVRWFEGRSAPIKLEHSERRVIWLDLDITERKVNEEERMNLETQLRHAHQIESLGTLAGGIAHDLNNLLVPILGFSKRLQSELTSDPKHAMFLERIVTASEHAKELVIQILTASRKTEPKKEEIRLQDILKGSLKLLRATIPSTISINVNYDPAPATILADPTQVHQVIMNLMVNASQAMPEGGDISIEEKSGPFAFSDISGMAHSGDFVCLSIEDTGTGIEPEVLMRIFEPFFTTKRKEFGTGLGLSVIAGILATHQGYLEVSSIPQKGTVFRTYWPLVETKEPQHEIQASPSPHLGQARIMMVDDESFVLETGELLLGELGYQITTFSQCHAALETFLNTPEAFDLAIVDYTMPQMKGTQLAEKMKACRSDLPIILCSGFNDEVNRENYQQWGIDALVAKPYLLEDLTEAIETLIKIKENPPNL